MKALLVHHQREIMKTHDIGELLRLADEVAPGTASVLSECEALTTGAVRSRYPTSAPPTTRDGAARDLVLAARALDHVQRVLGRAPTSGA